MARGLKAFIYPVIFILGGVIGYNYAMYKSAEAMRLTLQITNVALAERFHAISQDEAETAYNTGDTQKAIYALERELKEIDTFRDNALKNSKYTTEINVGFKRARLAKMYKQAGRTPEATAQTALAIELLRASNLTLNTAEDFEMALALYDAHNVTGLVQHFKTLR